MAAIVIIGAGPAGLMAAECLARAGHDVQVYDHKPSAARKFLMAGRGGLNLTHSEDLDAFIARYGAAADWIGPFVRAFPPQDLRDWCAGLGEDTFVGSSGRVFPRSFKASPLLRAWLARLSAAGVVIHYGWRWTGGDAAAGLHFVHGDGRTQTIGADAALLALGGASWPKLGSDAAWTDILAARGVAIAPLRPANCGFIAQEWPAFFAEKYAGQPLKPVVLRYGARTLRGEVMLTAQGLEGGAIYALSAALRDGIAAEGAAVLSCDLRPDVSADELARRLSAPRGRNSFSNVLRKQAGLSPAAAGLLRALSADAPGMSAGDLAALIKDVRVTLVAPCAMARAISSAGGVCRIAVDDALMLRAVPGLFVAGEMLDWEAPTGGYLLQASFATAVAAAAGITKYLAAPSRQALQQPHQ